MNNIDNHKNKKSPFHWEGFRMVIAAILALLIGIMSVISGAMVLLNYNIPSYNVLNWLVVYNVILGGISLVAAILISHLLVFLYLYFLSQEVALESIKAMGFRVSVWTVIFLLTYKKINN